VRGFAGEEIDSLNEKVFGQLGFSRGAFVTVETLHDLTACQADVGSDPIKLRLRQSAANSCCPEIDIASCRQRKFSLNDDISEIQASSGTQHPIDLAKGAVLVG
jgi:hypothetical protein